MQQKKLTQSLIKINTLIKKFGIIFLIISIGFLINFYSGYRGVFPLDSFLIYEAGYKVLNNYHPFKDYWSITGPVLDYLQFLFFKIFGVNWLSYVLHSTVINVFISLLFFFFFLKIGLKKIYSLFYSLGASILAYPSIGTPFMDHHAFIFSLGSLMILFLAIKTNDKKFWLILPFLIFISFFSKQIPSSYLVLFFIIVVFYNIFLDPKAIKQLRYLIFSTASILVFLIFFFFINEIPIQNFIIQYLLYPLEIGNTRSQEISFNLDNVVYQFKFIYFAFIPSIFAFYRMLIVKKKNFEIKKDILLFVLIVFSIAIFLYSQIMTKNQILIFSLIPFCLGISNYFCAKYFNKNFVNYFILFILIVATIKFHLRFNESKKFMELNHVNFNLSVDAKILDKSLKGLNWITNEYSTDPNFELTKLIQIKKQIISDPKNKIIFSDYQILSSITKNKNILPNKWLDPLSVPSKENKYFNNYKNFFIKRLEEQKISTIYVTYDKKTYLNNIFKSNCIKEIKINEIFAKLQIEKCSK